MIDSVMLSSQAMLDTLQPLTEALQGPHYLAAYQQGLSELCLPTDRRSPQLISSLQVRQHVLTSVFANHTTNYDAATAARDCRLPVAYIFSIIHFSICPGSKASHRNLSSLVRLGRDTSRQSKYPVKSTL
jgi:hypothetical protein